MPGLRDTNGNLLIEVIVRAALALLFVELEGATPFTRKIHIDELWLYKNPRIDSYVPTTILWPLTFITPALVILLAFLLRRDKDDACKGLLSLTLGLFLTGVITNIIKIIVGRPRPDFFWRCFPDGEMNAELKCTGDQSVINDGRKSFPSGHSAFSFASMGFISLYMAGKLHVFNLRGRGRAWRLLVVLVPMIIALCVALSRTCDYHHHWQDVVAGSVLGLALAHLSYRQYFPRLTSIHSDRTYTSFPQPVTPDDGPQSPHEQVKWI